MIDVILLSEGEKKSGPSTWKNELMVNLKIHNLTIVDIPTIHIVSLKSLLTIMQSKNIHTYHIGGTTILYLIIARIFNKKVIYTVHGDFYAEHKDKTGLKKMLWLPLNLWALNLAHTITYPSKYIKQKIIEKRPEVNRKSVVIYNSISREDEIDDDEEWKKVIYLKKKNNKPFNILSITSFTYQEKTRGLIPVIEAVKKVSDKYQNIKYTILGDGHLLKSYKKKAHRRNKKNNIFFLGFKNPKPFLRSADLFIHSTFLDNLPYVILEAMKYPLPIIAVPTGGIPEMLPKDHLIEPTEKEFYKKIEQIITNKETRIKMINKNKFLIEKFLWKKNISYFLKLYE